MDSRTTERHPTAQPIPMSLGFLESITSNFSKEQEIGSGGYAVVYKGILRCGLAIAVKRFNGSDLGADERSFMNEASSLMDIKHDNVVRLLGFCAESRGAMMMKQPNGKCIVGEQLTRILCFEYMCKGSLDKHLSDESSGLEWNMRYKIIKGICSGLKYLHERNIIHLDLKPQNILMDTTMMPKIADFGLSRLLDEKKSKTVTSNLAGTLGYMAPEYILRRVISKKADIFSLGVIIIEILKGCKDDYPSYGQSTEVFTEKVLSNWRNRFKRSSNYTALLELHTQLVKQCINIALDCVHPDKEKRPNVSDIIKILNAAEGSWYVQIGKDLPAYHQVLVESWRNMVGISQGNKELKQIRVCAEIGLECMCIDSNPRRRPTTEDIHDRLIYRMESMNLSTETSESSTSVMTQPECCISEAYHPSASTAKKPNTEPPVKQKGDSKCLQESVNNNQCSGYYTWEEIITEKRDNYFNVGFHDGQTSKNLDYFVVVDFKATREKGKQINPQEIIEFSSVLVDGSTGQLEFAFHTYVRPRQRPKLTDYCRDLNGIRQKDVDAGVELAVALRRLGAWLQKMGTKKCSGFCFVVVTWGNWDCRSMLEPECRSKGIGRPSYFDQWINLRIPFVAALGGSKPRADLADAVKMAGMEWEGRPRGASDDAHNIARLLGELMRRGIQLGITSSLAPMPAPQLL